jgi:hypothetical protein
LYLAKLQNAGFLSPEIVGKTGYATSKYTEAVYVRATKGKS